MKNREEFLNAKLSDISQVYKGRRECCRCGCGGFYTSTSFMDNPRSSVDDEFVSKMFDTAKKAIVKDPLRDVIYGVTYVDVAFGKGGSLTFYFDELK